MMRWIQCLVVAVGLVLGATQARAQEPAEPAPVEQVASTEEAAADQAPVEAPVEAEAAAAAEEEWVEEEAPSPWTVGLISSMLALGLGGFAAILGIWVDRDKSRPVVFAGAMSVLIFSAILVGMIQSYLDAIGAIEARADLDRMLDMVEEIGAESGDPELAALAKGARKGRPRRGKAPTR